jgi:hypothetical protein
MARPSERSYLQQAVRGVVLLTGLAVAFVAGAAVIAVVLTVLVG